MLLSIRDRARGWVAWVIVGFISIPFALWGLHSYFSGPDTTVVARAGGQEITSQDFSRAFQSQVQQLREAYGDQFPSELLDDQGFRESVLNNLVNEALLRQFLETRGFAVADGHLAQSIRSVPAFRDNGAFSPQRYEQVVSMQYGSAAAFEHEMRGSIMMQQLRGGITDSAMVTDKDIDTLIRVRDQRRELHYALLPAAHYAGQVAVSDDEVEAFHEENRDDFRTRERVRLAFLELDPRRVAGEISVSEEDLREMYESERRRFSTPEERRARHILISLDERDPDEARQLAASLRERLADGASFDALAAEYSDDPVSASDGGSLGWVARDDMVAAFEDALYALEPGAISDPVRTRFGIHLIRVDETRGGEVTPFVEVRDELEERYRRDRVERRFFDMAERLADLTFDFSGSLEPAAEELGLEIRETDWFTQDGGDGLAQHAAIVAEAFDPEVLEEGLNSVPIELADDRVIVVRLAEHEPARVRPLAEVRDQVEERVRNKKAHQLAYERGQELLAALRDGELDWADLARAEAGMEMAGPVTASRRDEQVPLPALREAFRLPRPGDDGARLGWAERQDGSFVLVRVDAVHDGDPAALSAEERNNLGQQLAQQRAMAEMQAFVEALRSDADVETYPDRI